MRGNMKRTLSVKLGLLALAAGLACASKMRVQASAVAPAAGDGMRIELKESKLENGRAFLSLVAYNDSDYNVTVNRNQIALVGPNGVDYFRAGGRELHEVKPRGNHKVNIEVDSPGVNWRQATGLYVRFDGVWA